VVLRVATGSSNQTSPLVIEKIEAESRNSSFRARLGAMFKMLLAWMEERFSYFFR
jgi:hypothetical protein